MVKSLNGMMRSIENYNEVCNVKEPRPLNSSVTTRRITSEYCESAGISKLKTFTIKPNDLYKRESSKSFKVVVDITMEDYKEAIKNYFFENNINTKRYTSFNVYAESGNKLCRLDLDFKVLKDRGLNQSLYLNTKPLDNLVELLQFNDSNYNENYPSV